MLVKLDHLTNFRGENKKCSSCHHLGSCSWLNSAQYIEVVEIPGLFFWKHHPKCWSSPVFRTSSTSPGSTWNFWMIYHHSQFKATPPPNPSKKRTLFPGIGTNQPENIRNQPHPNLHNKTLVDLVQMAEGQEGKSLADKGCWLNPKGWCIGTPYLPLSTPFLNILSPLFQHLLSYFWGFLFKKTIQGTPFTRCMGVPIYPAPTTTLLMEKVDRSFIHVYLIIYRVLYIRWLYRRISAINSINRVHCIRNS